MRTSVGSRGEDGGAHSGVSDGLSELGEADTAANRWRRSLVAEEGNGGAGDIQGFRRLLSW